MSYAGLLTDTCTIVRRARGAFNTITGAYAASTDTPVYSGACRVAPRQVEASQVVVGEEAVVDRSQWVFLPTTATGVKVEDIVKVTASENADIVNREMVVRDTAAEHSPVTSAGARWLVVEDLQEGP